MGLALNNDYLVYLICSQLNMKAGILHKVTKVATITVSLFIDEKNI